MRKRRVQVFPQFVDPTSVSAAACRRESPDFRVWKQFRGPPVKKGASLRRCTDSSHTSVLVLSAKSVHDPTEDVSVGQTSLPERYYV